MGIRIIPKYHAVKLADGVEVKVSALRLNSADNLALCAAIGDGIAEGNTNVFMALAPKIVTALRGSLAENHPEGEADELLSELRISSKVDSPYIQCCFALMGRDPVTEVADADDE